MKRYIGRHRKGQLSKRVQRDLNEQIAAYGPLRGEAVLKRMSDGILDLAAEHPLRDRQEQRPITVNITSIEPQLIDRIIREIRKANRAAGKDLLA